MPTIIQGPAILKRGTAVFYLAGNIEIEEKPEDYNIPSDFYGSAGRRRVSMSGKITATPLPFNAAAIAQLFPYAITIPGALLAGETDTPIVIHTKAGKTYTFTRTALTKMPPLSLQARSALLGATEWSFCKPYATALNTAGAFSAWADEVFADASWVPASVISGPYDFTLGGAPFKTRAGCTIDWGMSVTDEKEDSVGVYDWSFGGLAPTITWSPHGLSPAEWEALKSMQGASALPIGGDLADIAKAFTAIKTGKFSLAFPAVAPIEAKSLVGAKNELSDSIKMQVLESFAAGVRQPLFTIGTGA